MALLFARKSSNIGFFSKTFTTVKLWVTHVRNVKTEGGVYRIRCRDKGRFPFDQKIRFELPKIFGGDAKLTKGISEPMARQCSHYGIIGQ